MHFRCACCCYRIPVLSVRVVSPSDPSSFGARGFAIGSQLFRRAWFCYRIPALSVRVVLPWDPSTFGARGVAIGSQALSVVWWGSSELRAAVRGHISTLYLCPLRPSGDHQNRKQICDSFPQKLSILRILSPCRLSLAYSCAAVTVTCVAILSKQLF